MTSILESIRKSVLEALVKAFGEKVEGIDPMVVPATNPRFGDYQSNVALPLGKQLKLQPKEIAAKIIENLTLAEVCEKPEIAGPGFINFTIKPEYVAEKIKLIYRDPRLGIEQIKEPQKIIVDFSSPNIAKEMHVGHLRSTIIGDSLAKILEFRGHDVLRLNHVGDWGTQFGMLIAYLDEVYPEALTTKDAIELGDLVTFYRQAKEKFDQDEAFQEKSRACVVKLQSGDEKSRYAWNLLCEQSRKEFKVIYDILNITITERGESFYNPLLADIVEELDRKGVLTEDHGAKCVFVEGFLNKEGEPLPLIVQKTDGGYNYATTDLAAIKYRVTQDRAQRMIYVTDAGQANHFALVFKVASRGGILPENVEVVHVPFGLVLGADGKKFRTRSGDTVRLKDLLDEAIARTKAELLARLQEDNRTETEEFINEVATVVGISAVKYADLSQNRTSNYIFSYDKMLALQGNTAPYLLYAYVRIQGISRKGNVDYSKLETDLQLILSQESELVLAKHILQLCDILLELEKDLLPNRLCQYLFELSQKFNQFYDQCPVLSAVEPELTSRLVLCDLTARTLKLGLNLLGIVVLERM